MTQTITFANTTINFHEGGSLWIDSNVMVTIMMYYNLMSLFRQVVLKSKLQATLSTLVY